MHKVKKGEYGYISYQRKMVILRTILYFALCAAIFIIGLITTGTRRNLLTVVAVLGCLPASKSLVNAIMFIRARGCSESAHEVIARAMSGSTQDITPAKEDGISSSDMDEGYDLYMTSYQENYPISHITVCGNMVTGLCEDMSADMASKCEKHIGEQLKADGHKGLTVKIFTDADKYAQRLLKLNEHGERDLSDVSGVMTTLMAIAL